jgi:GR25 family glycosyltransferase involved in LPS biosynthesis
LEHRIDRKEQIIKTLSQHFPEGIFYRIPGILNIDSPCIGIAQAHINALEDAIKNNYKHILIMEDDMLFNEFEKNFSEWNGNKFTIGVANGTDALKISISSLELKGKTIFYIPSNTYIATALSTYFSLVNNFDIKFIHVFEIKFFNFILIIIFYYINNLPVMSLTILSLKKSKTKFSFYSIYD